jgi:GNAT superfamily N-acetyltransferase
MSKTRLEVRPLETQERPMIGGLLARRWGSPQIVSRGKLHDASRAAALGCFDNDRLAGLATYEITAGELEVLTLDAFEPRRGVGTRLLEALRDQAQAAGCGRLWLITSNDNLDAVRFYQRRGLRLAAVHPGAIELARELKPTIPRVGEYGIEVRDELEFELKLDGGG